MSSARSASFIDSAASAAPPSSMSRPSSVGTAELGRLALTGRASSSPSDMPATTRGAAKREAANPKQSSAQPAGKSDKGKQRAAPSSSKPTRQQPRRLSKTTSTQRPKPDDDDDDDDDDSDDSDGDDDDRGGGGSPAAPDPRQAISRRVLQIHLPFEPSQHSFAELASPNLPHRNEARQILLLTLHSTLFRAMVVASAQLVRTHADMTALHQAVTVQGREWSRQMVSQMRLRWKIIHQEYYSYQSGGRGEDAGVTIQRIKALFIAVEDTIRNFPAMSNGSHLRLIEILVNVFEIISRLYTDVRPAGAALAFAGGASQYEHNLWLQFATISENWQPCLEVMRRLGQMNYCSGLFRQKEAAWKSIWAVLRTVHATWKTDEVSAFMIGLRQRLAGMDGMFGGFHPTQARADFVCSVD
ncbi:hypothetical protein AC579_6231 [Pseudocercospora musae]|uniref:Uncharacterized protein n=1 Tax=Pseudocercospora musae TaxID=113226 RepID=A0A139HBY6_9PEZI|nr:hypothetical protein AC579_6231 [Pseudocercospora musae]